MNWRLVRLISVHELRMLVRAGRAVLLALVLPAVLMPLMLFAARYNAARQERIAAETTYRYAVVGTRADEIRAAITASRTALASATADAAWDLQQFKLAEVPVPDPERALEVGRLHFLLQTFTGPEAELLAQARDDKNGKLPKRNPGPLVQVAYRGHVDSSWSGAFLMERLLAFGRREATRTLPADDPRRLYIVESTSVATPTEVAGSLVGRFLTAVMVLLMLSGGSVAAMDIVAGERERGTLETLLTTAAGRAEIIAAKLITVTATVLVSVSIQGLNFFIYLRLGLIPLPARFALDISTTSVIAVLLLLAPLAAAVGALLLLISSHARTYKEAQMYFLPAFLLSLIPSLAAVLPGLRLRSAIALVPLANVSVAVREILTNRYDIPMIGVTFVTMLVTAGVLMRASARLLASESIVAPPTESEAPHSTIPTLFENRVPVWFAILWALLFAVASNVPALASLRRQVLFNELALFGGAGILMIWVYRLDVRTALAFRPFPWPMWIVMPLAAVSANVMGTGLFRILNTVFPISAELAEQMNALVPHDLPAWQLYLLIAVIPGVIEELVFRGLLLHGLRHRFRPVYLPLVIGGIFGLFHFTLFRIGPTAVLGVFLTWIAMRSGSVFPGMVMHVLHNAFAVWVSNHDWPIGALDWAHYVGATVIFILTMWVVYRVGTGRRSNTCDTKNALNSCKEN